MADNQQYYGSPIAPPPGTRMTARDLSSGGGTPWRLLIASAVVFVLVLVIYAGMAFGYEPYINGQIANQDAQLKQVENEVSQGSQSADLSLFSQLYNIGQLNKRHVIASKLFGELEKNTLPSVRITNVQFSILSGAMILAGTAPSWQTLVQQSSAWEQDPAVASFMVNSFKSGSGAGSGAFSATVTFAAGTFMQN